MSMITQLFTPYGFAKGLTIAGSTTSASGSFDNNVAKESPDILVVNEGTTTAFVRWGYAAQGAVTAVATDIPVAAGTSQVFFKDNADTVAVIYGTGSGNVFVYPGKGF